jgi:hypothetical protein
VPGVVVALPGDAGSQLGPAVSRVAEVRSEAAAPRAAAGQLGAAVSGAAAGRLGAAVPGVAAGQAGAVSAGNRRWPWAAAAVLALAALGSGAYLVCAGGGGAGANAATPEISAGPAVDGRGREDGAAEAMLDRTGADGVFVVTVTGLECGVAAPGPVEPPHRVHEQLCLVSVSVENAGQEARPLDGGAQRAIDIHGREYAVADRAAVFLNERAPSLLDAIPGDATVHGVLPFEIPSDAHLVALLVRESAGTRGARIALS